MESRIKPSMSMIKGASLDRMRRGAMLVTVLIITAVGLLFGAGALLLFKYQSQMRVDRQHELEKVYAVRSVLNYIKRNGHNIPGGSTFVFSTRSDRELRVIAKPVKRIFPDLENPLHLDMKNEGNNNRYFLAPILDPNKKPDYEYGASDENFTNGFDNCKDGLYGLMFPDNTTANAKWWVNIGMPGTGGWAQEQYGRRYYFEPREYVGMGYSGQEKDILRFCIIRNITNTNAKTGYRYGWPLTRLGERAIVLEVRPSSSANNAELAEMGMTVSEWVYTGSEIEIRNRFAWNDKMYAVTTYMGLQIAGDNISLYYTQKSNDSKLLTGYIFSPETYKMSEETYKYFTGEITIDGEKYDGMETNDCGVIAPELRAVFEIEAAAGSRMEVAAGSKPNDNVNFLTDFGVAPAYQYDVFLEHPEGVTNLATVAQRVLLGRPSGRGSNKFSVRTYDTHGTENKGFRKDEKLNREQSR